MKIKILIALCFGVFLILFLITNLNTHDRNKSYTSKDLDYIPKNLEEAIVQLDIIFSDSTKNEIINMPEEDFKYGTHMSTGRWIRNAWVFRGERELGKYFNNLEIYHPDDMSGIILTSYYRHLHNQDLRVEEQVEHYKEFWRKQEEHNNDTAYALRYKIEGENYYRERKEEPKLKFPIGSQVEVWANYNIFDARSPIIGEIIDWRTTVRESGAEYLQAKIKVIQYMGITMNEEIENKIRQLNQELWVSATSIREIDDNDVQQNSLRFNSK